MRTYQEQAHAYYMRLPAYGAVVVNSSCARDHSHHTRYVGATSPDPSLGNPTCKYGFMSLAAARCDRPKVAFDLQKFADSHRTKICRERVSDKYSEYVLWTVHTLDGRQLLDVQLHLPPDERSQLE